MRSVTIYCHASPLNDVNVRSLFVTLLSMVRKQTDVFVKSLEGRWEQERYVCIGLDTDYTKIPSVFRQLASEGEAVYSFNKSIVDATQDIVCAYKPNSAYYEAMGNDGLTAMAKTIDYIKTTYPSIPVILDAKRGDIGATSEAYVRAVFDMFNADAVTVHPYMGKVSLEPFLRRADKGIIVMGANSNLGAGEFQDLLVGPHDEPLYKYVCRQVADTWNDLGNCAVTAGATEPHKIAEIRSVVGDMPILVLGVGAQGGEVLPAVKAGHGKDSFGLIINSSRSILYASNSANFAEAAREVALDLNRQIKKSYQTVERA